jgi:25S rRNA (uracil2843-N3)-methyltransferase
MVRKSKLPSGPPKASRPDKPSKKVPVAKEPPAAPAQPTIPTDLQQKSLNIFRDAFEAEGEDSNATLQEVKGHLFNRDFAAAFGKEEYLRVYAGRWSPSRALGYAQILLDVQDLITGEDSVGDDDQSPYRVLCVGGGAGAELVALAAWANLEDNPIRRLKATFLDIAAWGPVVASLHKAVTNAPPLSQYASAAAKEANVPLLLEDAFSVEFHQQDALKITDGEQCQRFFSSHDLITMMFTLNELYSTSMANTQAILARITAHAPPGTILLVVDSPGSYSTISMNGTEKKYPMQWLLDFTLTGPQKKGPDGVAGAAKWEKLLEDESRWFRLPAGLKYPIELENMRYQIHLYRRLESPASGETSASA